MRLRTLARIYRTEVEAELAKFPVVAAPPISEADLAPLPAPVQRYFRSSGFVGRPRPTNVRIVWKEMRLRRSRDSGWMKLHVEQVNFAPRPMRIALMRGKIAGAIPFDGRDKYQDGHGSMLVKLMKVFTVGDSRGSAMDESELVTVLSEALLWPSAALQPYVRWEAIDDRSARARISDGPVSVAGVFHFNDADEVVRFDTEDRWQDGNPPRKIPWSASIGGYRVE